MLKTFRHTGLEKIARHHKTENEIYLDHIGGSFYFTGLDEPQKVKSFEDADIVWAEEASELTFEDFQELDMILRGGERRKQIIMSFNPISHNLWQKKEFFSDGFHQLGVPSTIDYGGNKCTRLITTIEHNPKINDPDYVNRLNALTGRARDVFLYSKWGVREGLVYDWMTTDSIPTDCVAKFYSLDFGYTNPMALVEITYDGVDYYVRELIYKTHMTTADLIERMKSLNIGDRPIYCDSAEPDRIEELYRAGFNAYKAEKNVRDGVDFLISQSIKVDKNAFNIIDEMSSYLWDEKKDIPEKGCDHALDAVRYAIYSDSRKVVVDVW